MSERRHCADKARTGAELDGGARGDVEARSRAAGDVAGDGGGTGAGADGGGHLYHVADAVRGGVVDPDGRFVWAALRGGGGGAAV